MEATTEKGLEANKEIKRVFHVERKAVYKEMEVWSCVCVHLQTHVNTHLRAVSGKSESFKLYTQVPRKTFSIPSGFTY